MAILKKDDQPYKRPEIDLTGPDGNVFCLLGHAKNLCRQLGIEFDVVKSEMMMGDYENAVETFDTYFGEYVDLLR